MGMDSVSGIITLIEQMNKGRLVIPGAGAGDVPDIEDFHPENLQFQSEDEMPRSVRNAVLMRDGGVCVFCGRTDKEVHHLVTRALGDHHPDALITLCLKHHRGFMHIQGQVYDFNPYIQLDGEL